VQGTLGLAARQSEVLLSKLSGVPTAAGDGQLGSGGLGASELPMRPLTPGSKGVKAHIDSERPSTSSKNLAERVRQSGLGGGSMVAAPAFITEPSHMDRGASNTETTSSPGSQPGTASKRVLIKSGFYGLDKWSEKVDEPWTTHSDDISQPARRSSDTTRPTVAADRDGAPSGSQPPRSLSPISDPHLAREERAAPEPSHSTAHRPSDSRPIMDSVSPRAPADYYIDHGVGRAGTATRPANPASQSREKEATSNIASLNNSHLLLAGLPSKRIALENSLRFTISAPRVLNPTEDSSGSYSPSRLTLGRPSTIRCATRARELLKGYPAGGIHTWSVSVQGTYVACEYLEWPGTVVIWDVSDSLTRRFIASPPRRALVSCFQVTYSKLNMLRFIADEVASLLVIWTKPTQHTIWNWRTRSLVRSRLTGKFALLSFDLLGTHLLDPLVRGRKQPGRHLQLFQDAGEPFATVRGPNGFYIVSRKIEDGSRTIALAPTLSKANQSPRGLLAVNRISSSGAPLSGWVDIPKDPGLLNLGAPIVIATNGKVVVSIWKDSRLGLSDGGPSVADPVHLVIWDPGWELGTEQGAPHITVHDLPRNGQYFISDDCRIVICHELDPTIRSPRFFNGMTGREFKPSSKPGSHDADFPRVRRLKIVTHHLEHGIARFVALTDTNDICRFEMDFM